MTTKANKFVEEPIFFELDGYQDPGLGDVEGIDEAYLRQDLMDAPTVAEPRVVRHFHRLSEQNFPIDRGLFPLGSCTMKYNPRFTEQQSFQPGFADLHPLADDEDAQGALELLFRLEEVLTEVTGMAATTLLPAAGAHGEWAAMLMFRAYHDAKGQGHRNTILIPDSAHGTNPASAALAGYDIVEIETGDDGFLHLAAVEAVMNDDVAGLMMTNPNTLGVYERDIEKIADLLHSHDALLYMDGANLNAIMGKAKPGKLGADAMHFNLHKTFSTPHGGGGPGSGPVAVSERLKPFLPSPRVERTEDGKYALVSDDASIGRVKAFWGHFGMAVRALGYSLRLGAEGITEVTERAVLNAAYIRARLKDVFDVAFDAPSLHEVVFSDKLQKENGVTTRDIAKRLLNHGFHAPTTYFPLIVSGALMVEPTETEEREELDRFISVMRMFAQEAEEGQVDAFTEAPTQTYRRRLDETTAARNPILRWTRAEGNE